MENNLRKRRDELMNELAKFQGQGEIIAEIENINTIDELKIFIKERTRKIWADSTPIAQELCQNNIKIAEEYMEGKGV